MIKNVLLATTIVSFASTASFAAGTDVPAPQMSLEQIETLSTQGVEGSATTGAVLTLIIFLLLWCAAACGGGGSSTKAFDLTPL